MTKDADHDNWPIPDEVTERRRELNDLILQIETKSQIGIAA